MQGKATVEPLSEAHGEELGTLLEDVKALLGEAEQGGDWADLDDRAIKPLQDLLGTTPAEPLKRKVAFGLGEILQREFDLDWVTARTREGEAVLALHIPLSFHLMFPDEFFEEDAAGGGKAINVRVAYLHWSDWINEHQFDEDGEVDF